MRRFTCIFPLSVLRSCRRLGGAACRPEAVPYLGGFYDEQIRRIGNGLLGHLEAPPQPVPLCTDTLSLELTACVVDAYSVDARRGGETRADIGWTQGGYAVCSIT